MTEPGDEAAAAGRGRMRAARADREHAVEVLKTAFVQERLTKDELDARVSRALAARTYADLAALTDDIPPDIAPVPEHSPAAATPAANPDGQPASTPARTLGTAVFRTGLCLTGGLALVEVIHLAGSNPWAFFAFMGIIASVVAASGFLAYGFIDAWQEWRASGPSALPPGAPGPGGPGRAVPGGGGQQAGQASSDPASSWQASPDPSRRPRRGGPAQAARPAPWQPRAALLAGLVVDLRGRGILLHGLDPAQR